MTLVAAPCAMGDAASPIRAPEGGPQKGGVGEGGGICAASSSLEPQAGQAS